MFCTFGLHTYIIPTGFALVFTVFKSTAVNGLRLTIVKQGEKKLQKRLFEDSADADSAGADHPTHLENV